MLACQCHGFALHTDRSGIPSLPGLVLTACGRAPAAGGESLLVDGQLVYDELAATKPAARAALSALRSVLFGSADGYLGSVFTKRNGAVSIRLRTDDLARFAPTVMPHLPALRAAITKHAVTRAMSAGAGYVVDNHRWLHGRNGFSGRRVLYRVTANPHAHTLLPGIYPGKSAYERTV